MDPVEEERQAKRAEKRVQWDQQPTAPILNRGMSVSKVWWPELSQLSLCSEFDKENLMEFSLISLLLIHFTTVTMHLPSHGPHVTLVMWSTVTVTCNVTICDTPSHHCDKVTWYFPALHLVVVNKKRKEKKRNINNDLANLPSHDKEEEEEELNTT